MLPFLPRPWFDQYFGSFTQRLPNRTYRDNRLLRRSASLILAELVTGQPWPECAKDLGFGSDAARYALNTLGKKFASTGLWPLFANTVELIGDELDGQASRVSYTDRRRALESWSMSAPDWAPLYDGLNLLQRRQAKADPRVLSAVVWSEVNQAECPHSPIVLALRGTAEARAVTSRASAFNAINLVQGQRYRFRRRLDLYTARLGKACDLGTSF
ncbi:hypothetical protein ACFYYS_03020 [Streptomyces sp. NPDC002120]|uniref:hypothetical protein n=1 Tax=Streptomyces sp. NPDC002120 TaxID=3364631 RepID=UPI0036C6A759